jgi:NADH-quinone oxidoreductase subunit L
MEGPTPVSALIHAATMVTAGIYMVSRSHTLFEQSDDAMFVICVIGVSTAILAALIGLAQNDIKRVLAYSTVSQLGYMFAACGAGVFAAGMYHVMTHAFFKACLFLCSGSVIHAIEHGMHAKADNHGEADHGHDAPHAEVVQANADLGVPAPDPHDPQDMRNMGGLSSKARFTFATMLVATLAICGIIPFAGYWSKDEILWRLFNDHYKTGSIPHDINLIVFGVGAITALITAFYMFRMIMKTFIVPARTDAARNAAEGDWKMLLPLGVLAIMSTITGWAFMPFPKFEEFLGPSVVTPGYAPHTAGPSEEHLIGYAVMGVIVLVILTCFGLYKNSKTGDLLGPADRVRFTPFWWLNQKFRIDELNNLVWVEGGKRLADLVWRYDESWVDGLVNGVASFIAKSGAELRRFQTGYVRNYAFSMVIGILFVLIVCLAQR